MELQRRLLEAVYQFLDRCSTPGVTVALFVDGQPILESSVGCRTVSGTEALAADARFYIYSVTKTLLAIAVLQLVERDEIVLDAPIQVYLPDVSLEQPVTVRQLLNHTGGIPCYGGMRVYHDAVRTAPSHPWTPDEFLQRTLPRGLTFEPGQGWAYSNIGFLLVKLLLEQVTGTPLDVVLQQQIFGPLALQHTAVAQSLEDAKKLAPGYSRVFNEDGSLRDVTAVYHPGWVSHGVIISTVPELARIFDALFSGHLLPPTLLEAMLDPIPVPGQHPLFARPSYGLGVMIDTDSPYGMVAGHGGGGPGYSTGALHFPNVAGRCVTCVALANGDQDDVGLTIAFRMADVFAEIGHKLPSRVQVIVS